MRISATRKRCSSSCLAEGMRRNAGDAEQILTLLAEKPRAPRRSSWSRWFDQFDARNNVPLLALEMDLESRRNASFAALLDEVVAKQQKSLCRILERYFEVVGRDPPMPVDELASIDDRPFEGVALARQTRHSATLTSAKAVRILLGMPATQTSDAKTLATSDPRRSGEARLRQLRLRAGRCRGRGRRRSQAMARRGLSRNDGLDGGARRRAGVAQWAVERGADR